ncbi:hypothetical protein ACHQM5_010000 [Ranunculus cassubicifolius]
MASDEDYIDMEVSSSTSSSMYIPREFEFPGSLVDKERSTTSPADELFYKGNLLPLHLPPRLQMVEKLLQNTNISIFEYDTTTFTTPLESCNISPSESSRVSRELTPDECFFECEAADEMSSFINQDAPKKFWSKKMKLIKHSHKLIKASRAYVKSLFTKSGCSDESCTLGVEAQATATATVTIAKECLNKYIKVSKKNPFGQITSRKEKTMKDDDGGGHRRSFSGAIKQRHSSNKSSASFTSSSNSSSSCSSFSSSNSNGLYEVHLLKRSSSANSDIESSVQGAIAHCKMSQLRKTTSDVGFCQLSSRVAACEDQGKCRG